MAALAIILMSFVLLLCGPTSGFLLSRTSAGSSTSPLAKPPLRVGTFNVQVLGKSKIETASIVKNLLKIISRYDLLVIEELRDATGTVADRLLSLVNAVTLDKFGMVLSTRDGRTTSKEQYIFLHRLSRVTKLKEHEYADTADKFERTPMTVSWQALDTVLETFATMAVHLKPDDVVNELHELEKAIKDAKNHLGTQSIFVMGDFNADCNYLNEAERRNTSLGNATHFRWFVDQESDTMAQDSDCAYDNIIAPASFKMDKYVVPNSVQVVKTEEELKISQQEALMLSDHYPVEFLLNGKVNPKGKEKFSIQHSFTVEIKTDFPLNDIRTLYRYPENIPEFNITVYKIGTKMDHVVAKATATSATRISAAVKAFHKAYPLIVDYDTLEVATEFMPQLYNLQHVYGSDVKGYGPYEAEISCNLDSSKPLRCQLTVTRQRN